MRDTRLFDAIEFAARAHHGQFRKASRVPYILHPLNVARSLIECDASEEIVIAALLHDVVEDTTTTLDQVRAEFGDAVARLVNAMSEPNRRDKWEIRKRGTLHFLETAPQEVLLIELADKLDNVCEVRADLKREGEAVWKKFNRGREQQKWYYEQLAEVLARRVETECGKMLAREFGEVVGEVFRKDLLDADERG